MKDFSLPSCKGLFGIDVYLYVERLRERVKRLGKMQRGRGGL